MVSFICVCVWRFFFICLFVRTVSFGGWWLPAFPLCEVTAKKPGVCSILLQPLWLAARPEVAAGASASLAQKVRSSGHWEGQHLGARSKAEDNQPAKQSPGSKASGCHRDVIEEAKYMRVIKICRRGELHVVPGTRQLLLY